MEIESNRAGQPVGSPVADWSPPSLPSRTTMQGRFCRLEPLVPEKHAKELHAANLLNEDATNWTYLAYGPFETEADYLAWTQQTCSGSDPLFYAIIDLTSEHAIGVASYLRISPANGSIEVGHLNFSPKLQKTPAATEAMYLMMQHAFDIGYRRYEWKCDALNAPSRVAAQRLGLKFEGVFRQHTIYKGRNRDTAWYAAIDTEWPALEKAFQAWLAPSNFDQSGQQRQRLSDLQQITENRHHP